MADYCTPAELRTQIEKTGTTGAGTDAALGVIITAASRTIDRHCNRPDGFVALAVAVARYYNGMDKPYLLIDECTSVTAVAVKDSPSDTTYTAWAATDYQVCSGDPGDPDWNSTPYNMIMVLPTGDYSTFISGKYSVGNIVPMVRVTATWGYATTAPAGIKEACIALSARWFKQGTSAWADTLASPELGTLLYQRDNVDIRNMLARFVKPAIGRW
jgi:hypothetical protein